MNNPIYLLFYRESYCDYGVYRVCANRESLNEVLNKLFKMDFSGMSIERINDRYSDNGKSPLDFECEKAETFLTCGFWIEEHELIGGENT